MLIKFIDYSILLSALEDYTTNSFTYCSLFIEYA